MANTMIERASESEVGKTVIKPLVSGALDCKKDVANEDQCLEIQCAWGLTKCNAKQKSQTHVGLNFQAKIASKTGSKSSPEGPKWRLKSILGASWEAKLKRSQF